MDLQFVKRNTRITTPLDRAKAQAALLTLRREWEVAAEGESLVNISASVGLMLLDVATKLGMTPEEQKVVLGARLYQEAFKKTQKT
ncbi:MAG: hypothetical protein HND47_12720 [Chloroflexi bacterium]|nr:hypothetical protein [Chloroflexota bacterium]